MRELAGPHGLQPLPHRDGTEGFFIADEKNMTDKTLLPGLSLPELEALVKDLGSRTVRARQVNDWLKKGGDFEDMRNLPAAFLGKLRSAPSRCRCLS